MRVAVDVTTLHDSRSGIRVVAEQLLPRLAARPDIEVVAYSASWRGRGDVRAMVDELARGVRVVGRPMAAQPLRQAWRRVDWPPIEWWTGPVDVVFGLNFVVPPTQRAARVALIHDLTAWSFPELCTSDTRQYPGLIDRAVAAGAHVVTPTRAVADEVVARLGAREDRVHPVHWAPRPMGAGSAGSAGSAGGGRYVLALGTVEPRKDYPTLLRAFDRVAATDPSLELVVVGAPGWGVDAFESALAATTHRDRVTWLRSADDATIADLLARAAVFAYPSIYEGFGLPPLEAMAAGVPVVATAIAALEEVLGDAAVLVPVGDVDALAAALLDATSGERAARTARVVAGRARAARFSWDAAADGVLAALETAATVRGS